jgi:hypothetical protein
VRSRRRNWLVIGLSVAVVATFGLLNAQAKGGPPAAQASASAPATTATTTRPHNDKPKPSTTTTTRPANPTPVAYDVPAAVAADCSVDVTTALLAWFDSVPDNSVLNFGTGACYEIEGSLYIHGRRDLSFVGHGATFIAKTDGSAATPPNQAAGRHWPRRRAHWWVDDSANITISALTVDGADPYSGMSDLQYDTRFEVQSGVVVSGSENVTLDSLLVSKVYGDFVTIGGKSSGVTVRGCHFVTAGRQGIAITGASHVVVQDNTIDDVRWAMIDLEANGASSVVDDVHLLGNETGSSRWVWLASVGPGAHISNIEVRGNHQSGTSLTFVLVNNDDTAAGRRGPFTIADNEFNLKPSKYSGFQLIGVDHVEVSGNVVHMVDGATPTMVSASRSDNIRVHDNDFTGASRIADLGDTRTWCEANDQPAELSKNVPC